MFGPIFILNQTEKFDQNGPPIGHPLMHETMHLAARILRCEIDTLNEKISKCRKSPVNKLEAISARWKMRPRRPYNKPNSQNTNAAKRGPNTKKKNNAKRKKQNKNKWSKPSSMANFLKTKVEESGVTCDITGRF